MAKTGRPRKKIDPVQVTNLAKIGCTYSEIGAVVGCDKSQISRRFATEVAKGHEELRMGIRRMQLQAAHKGNIVMLIWLGKQYLGQRDKQDVATRDETPTMAVTEMLVTTRAEASAVLDTMQKRSSNGNGNGHSDGDDAGLPETGRFPG
jgi:hypothetical protein